MAPTVWVSKYTVILLHLRTHVPPAVSAVMTAAQGANNAGAIRSVVVITNVVRLLLVMNIISTDSVVLLMTDVDIR